MTTTPGAPGTPESPDEFEPGAGSAVPPFGTTNVESAVADTADSADTGATATPARHRRAGRWWSGQTGLRHLVLAVIGGVALYFLTRNLSEYRNSQLATGEYYFIAVAGLTLLIGYNGQISLGHGAFMLLGGYTVALIYTHNPHFPLWGELLAAVAVAALAGAIVGLGAARLRGPYLAGATLALAVALPYIPSHYTTSLGGTQGLNAPTPVVPGWVGDSTRLFRWNALLAGIASLIIVVLLANLRRSGVGRAFRAVRDDEVAAQLAGLRIARTQVSAFIVSAACAGLAGALLVILNGSANEGLFLVTLSIGLLAAAILGGLGSLIGAAFGAFVLVVLGPSGPASQAIVRAAHLSTTKAPSVSTAIYGLELVLVMLIAPSGLAGIGRGLRRLVIRS